LLNNVPALISIHLYLIQQRYVFYLLCIDIKLFLTMFHPRHEKILLSLSCLINKHSTMYLPIKITLATLGITAFVTFLFTLSAGINLDNLLDAYGFLAVLGGAVCVVVSLVLFATGKKNYGWAQGFILSAGLLLLTGFFALSQITFSR